jgi:coenzyme PQQ synthesis protein D (PqqD)
MSATPTRFQASPNALATRVGDEIVLVDLSTDRIYSLNRTAARIWELVSDDGDRAQVERRMLEEFDVAPAQLAEAIDDLIASMTREGLLVGSV